MCTLFLYVTEFLAESNEGSYFLFKADTVYPGLLKEWTGKVVDRNFRDGGHYTSLAL